MNENDILYTYVAEMVDLSFGTLTSTSLFYGGVLFSVFAITFCRRLPKKHSIGIFAFLKKPLLFTLFIVISQYLTENYRPTFTLDFLNVVIYIFHHMFSFGLGVVFVGIPMNLYVWFISYEKKSQKEVVGVI